jgi:peptide/nickel transport system ATP-binding protein
MYLGKIVEENSVAGLFDAPRHPYTQALLTSVLTPEPGLGVPDTQLGMAYPNPIAPPPGCHFHPRCPRATDMCRNTVPRQTATPEGHVTCHLHDPQTAMYQQG